MRGRILLLAFVPVHAGCASLEGLRQFIKPPHFEQASQPAEVRLSGPAVGRPLGGAVIRIWTRVSNPNPFGFTLGTLDGTLYLDETRAASASFPLGLPLRPGEEAVIPLDLSISFSDLPGLSDVIRRAARGQELGYRLDGTIGVDAGRLGQPVFGPMTLVRGEIRTSGGVSLLPFPFPPASSVVAPPKPKPYCEVSRRSRSSSGSPSCTRLRCCSASAVNSRTTSGWSAATVQRSPGSLPR